MCTVDPVGTRHIPKTWEKKYLLKRYLNKLLWLFCDLQTGYVRLIWDAYFSESIRFFA